MDLSSRAAHSNMKYLLNVYFTAAQKRDRALQALGMHHTSALGETEAGIKAQTGAVGAHSRTVTLTYHVSNDRLIIASDQCDTSPSTTTTTTTTEARLMHRGTEHASAFKLTLQTNKLG